MVFTRHRRIKILSEAGYKWGSYTIEYFAKQRRQQVTDLEGQTLKLAADGSIRINKLDKKAIFDERAADEWRRLRFTLPALEQGSVVEYRYTVRSKGASNYLRDWAFQTSEPTRWSEFRAAIPSVLRYVIVKENTPALAIEEATTDNWPLNLFGHEYSKTNRMEIVHRRWVAQNVPALRDEPFTTTLDDYRAKINFQLAEFDWPWQRPEKIMNTWEKLAEELMDSPGFGGQLGRNGEWRRQAEALTTGLVDPEQKLRAIYDYVRATMKWNGNRGIFAGDFGKAFQARHGSGAEIALMLTSMLRAAGLEAHPVLISTRDHGKIIPVYPLLRQFNAVLTYVKAGEQEHFLDATDPLRPYNVLPVAALTETGWLVEKKTPRWVEIVNRESFNTRATVSIELAADGNLSGWLQANAGGYSALSGRRMLQDKKEDEYIREEWLKSLAGAKLDSFRISNKDSIHAPLTIQALFSASEYAQVADDKIYLNPILWGRREENPFKQPERTFPVDFGYATQQTYALNLVLPEGSAVLELPQNLLLSLPNDGGQFRRLAQVEGRHLQLMSQVLIRKSRFAPEEYKALREFYDRLMAAQAEAIVLKRETAASTAKKP
jgi:transglutaminase-like putative cysteine protease